MSERAKTIVAIYLAFAALFGAIVNAVSGDVMSGAIRLEVHLAAQQVRQDVVDSEHRAEAIGKAIHKTRAILNRVWETDSHIDRAEIAVLAALFMGSIAFAAGPRGARVLVGASAAGMTASASWFVQGVWFAIGPPVVAAVNAVLSAIGMSLALLPAIIAGAA